MKFLIIGLGNPGAEYQNTRHNIGFTFLDFIAEKNFIKFEVDRLGEICHFAFRGRTIFLLKPSTYMNSSGKAVSYWIQKLKITPSSTLTILDDLALPLGKVRIKEKGSSGGHNGLLDIEEKLKTQNYPRLKFGIGANFNKGMQAEYVLGKFSPQEMELVNTKKSTILEIVEKFASTDIQHTMNLFNKL